MFKLSGPSSLQLVPISKIHISWFEQILIILESSTCVPNTSKIPILAPIHNPDICPLWSERWELRTRPLGCHVSTITFLTCIISVLATFLAVGAAVVGFKVGWRIQANWKTRSEGWWKVWSLYRPGWWRGWRLRWILAELSQATEC
ncbi:hypothetical protein LHYA1_G000463 [Lachnellula hyalina]|uniref:Uncharacterized protein n=1 Tax=Lachnellula hyalina TaxID=1316788 RepID=A0A8H8RBN5_9HELO|nr:uncharacterized protein LHYA1_G000463 [Lachnellula hyalina]TVY30381.1 hypothetical protein LHYA1_G000463 [Lachnellula hyalina]